MESKVVVPAEGQKITLQNGKLNVPHNPIIPFIEGDGIGVDVDTDGAIVVETSNGRRSFNAADVNHLRTT